MRIVRLTAAVRCYTFPLPLRQRRAVKRSRGWRSLPIGARVLVFDTETTNDRLQNLLVGCLRLYEWVAGGYRLVIEGLILGDVLSEEDARLVQAYAHARGLRVYTRHAFVRDVFLPEVYVLGTLCLGFNLPFDLSRLAVRAVPGRGRWRGGFTFYLMPSKWDPPIRIKALDSKRAFIEFGSYRDRGYRRREAPRHAVFPGRFLDLRTLADALTGEGHSLESACEAFGVRHGKYQVDVYGKVTDEYLHYNRRDALATWKLYLKLVEEWHRHPFARVPTPVEVERDPAAFVITRAYSPATIGKAYLRAMRIRPRLEHQPGFSKQTLGRSMVAYYGGRSESHIRRQIVPVTYLDVLSMYPTVCALMGLWAFIIANRVQVEDATREAQQLLQRTTLDDLFDPGFWPRLLILAEVEPDGDVLPVRAQYQEGGDYQIGLNVVTAEPGMRTYYTLTELITSKLLTGRAPCIRRAWRFRAVGVQPGLRRVKLLGDVEVNPLRQDFFRVLIEKRHEFKQAQSVASEVARAKYFGGIQHGLKVLANAIYGILAEINEKTTGAKEAEVFGLGHFSCPITQEEHPGRYAFPPLAALITSGARLILAMLEVELRRHGATYAFCDTDSIAIVGPQETANAIRSRFAGMNPYAFGGDLLKREPENDPDPRATRDQNLYCLSISAKRYACFNVGDDGGIIIRGDLRSEHGLGHLQSPSGGGRDWMKEVWVEIIRWARGEIKEPGDGLVFADLAAVGRFPITKPAIWKLFDHLNTQIDPGKKRRVQRPYLEQVKPFNFMLAAFPDTGDITTGGEAYWEDRADLDAAPHHSALRPIRPIAPYESDPRKWRKLQWVDLHTGRPVRLTWEHMAEGLATSLVRVQTYRDVLNRHVTHPEAKAAGPNGEPCEPHTTGELSRLRVHVTGFVHIGKESHELEEVQAGLVPPGSTYVHYVDKRAEWKLDKQTLRSISRKLLAELAGLHMRSIKAIQNTARLPHSRHRRLLHRIAEELRNHDLSATQDLDKLMKGM